jgi:anti-sigma regulatory factor (Ser/Thr protein kinase)
VSPSSHEEPWTTLRIAAELKAVSAARRALVADLRAAAVTDRTVEDAALVIHELAENAVRHGGAGHGGPVEVAWRLQPGRVEMRVRDRGTAGFPAPAWPTARLDGGRGLHIVQQLCRSWDVRHGPDGTEVSAVLEVRPAEVAT